MEYYLPAIDIRKIIISSVIGFDQNLAKEHKDSISVVEDALTFMAKNKFAYFAIRMNIIENNIEVSHKKLIRSLSDLRKLAAKNTGLTAKNSEAFLYRLAVEVIGSLGSTFSEEESGYSVYPTLCLCFGEVVNSAATLDCLVFLLDYFSENYVYSRDSIESFMKSRYYNVTKKELSGFFARTPWMKEARHLHSRNYPYYSDMIRGFIHGQINVLNLMEKSYYDVP